MTATTAVQSMSYIGDARVRQRYIETTRAFADDAVADDMASALLEEWRAQLEESVAMIEMYSFAALTAELMHELGLQTASDVETHTMEIGRRLHAMLHLDLARFEATTDRVLGPPTDKITDPPLWEQARREFAAVCVEYPIADVERVAQDLDAPELGHRARTSYDALRAVLRRNDPAEAAKLKVAGNAYAMGRLSLREVAVMLQLDESDTVFELERAGYARSIETIVRCADESADATLARLAKGINERGRVAPPVDPEHVRRDVVASQRIENIDARRTI